MIIDTHGHMIPPDLLSAIRMEGAKLSALRIVEDPAGLSIAFGNSKPSRPIMKGLSDLTGRLAWMDKQGIDKQVNGGCPFAGGRRGDACGTGHRGMTRA